MLRVRQSKISGKGLFTDSAIPGRKKIGEFSGERISVREARRRAKNLNRIAIVEISYTIAIDGSGGGCVFEFVNHSCDPNVFIRIAYGRAEFYTRRRIKAGEELTCNYGDSHHDGKLPCACGSPKCAKFI
jgi:uncharacterized protein